MQISIREHISNLNRVIFMKGTGPFGRVAAGDWY